MILPTERRVDMPKEGHGSGPGTSPSKMETGG